MIRFYNFLSILGLLLLAGCENESHSPQLLSQEDLQGEWILTQLNASEAVDLNSDGESNTNLMLETNCFDAMQIDFQNEAYQLTYPRINFTGDTHEALTCENTLNTGTYTLENNLLTVTTTVDGSTHTESVDVELNNGQLTFSVTSSQVSRYIDLDATSNETSDLESLEFVFEK